jgi:hypothetical protein
VQDFVWWSGLTVADAKAGLAMAKSHLIQEAIDDQVYWFLPSTPPAKDLSQTIYLLPNYDEYIVSYADRSAVFDASHSEMLDLRGNVLFNYTIVLNGQVVGTWKRVLKKDEVVITLDLFMPLNEAERSALVAVANCYGAFIDKSVNVAF